MATALSSLETQIRRHLNETTAVFWSSAEIVDILNKGIKDLWGAVIDLFQEHFITVDITTTSISASTGSISNLPTDVFRVHLIEPKDTSSSGAYRGLIFVPRDYNSPEFIAARTLGDVDPSQAQVIYYCVTNAGAPVGAPNILIAPTLSTAIAAGSLRFVYVPTVAAKAAGDDNPIPGESDNALIAWGVGFCKAKEREDGSPDPNWLAVYGSEKQNITTRLTPRQTQEPDVAEPLFGGLW